MIVGTNEPEFDAEPEPEPELELQHTGEHTDEHTGEPPQVPEGGITPPPHHLSIGCNHTNLALGYRAASSSREY